MFVFVGIMNQGLSSIVQCIVAYCKLFKIEYSQEMTVITWTNIRK